METLDEIPDLNKIYVFENDKNCCRKLKKSCFKAIKNNSLLASGSFGNIYNIGNNKVVKVCSYTTSIMSEIFILSNIVNDNILGSEFIFLKSSNVYMIMNKFDCNLDQIEINDNKIKESLALQLISGIQYLHSCKFLHLDLCPKNILVNITKPIVLKIADFSLSKRFEDEYIISSTDLITALYRPPENLRGSKKYSIKSDLWSLGLCLYRIYYNKDLLNGKFIKSKETDENNVSRCILFELEMIIAFEIIPKKDSFKYCNLLNIDSELRYIKTKSKNGFKENKQLFICSLVSNYLVSSFKLKNFPLFDFSSYWDYVYKHFLEFDSWIKNYSEILFKTVIINIQNISKYISENLKKVLFLNCVILCNYLTVDYYKTMEKFGKTSFVNAFFILSLFKRKNKLL